MGVVERTLMESIDDFEDNRVRSDPVLLAESMKRKGHDMLRSKVKNAAERLVREDVLEKKTGIGPRDRKFGHHIIYTTDAAGLKRPSYGHGDITLETLEEIGEQFAAVKVPTTHPASEIIYHQAVFGGYRGSATAAEDQIRDASSLARERYEDLHEHQIATLKDNTTNGALLSRIVQSIPTKGRSFNEATAIEAVRERLELMGQDASYDAILDAIRRTGNNDR